MPFSQIGDNGAHMEKCENDSLFGISSVFFTPIKENFKGIMHMDDDDDVL